MLVEVVCRVLKTLHYQPRPEGAQRRDSGFPSSHTAWMAYACVTLARGGRHWAARALGLGLLVLVTGAGRVVSREHRVSQVAAGAAVGGSFALLWRGVVGAVGG